MSLVELFKSRAGTLFLISIVAGVGVYEWKNANALSAQAAPAEPAGKPSARLVLAEGRVATYPGRQITVSSEIAGRLLKVNAAERDQVQQGQELAEIDVSEQRAALAEAYARIKEADTEVGYQENELTRAQRLLEGRAIAKASLDRTGFDRDAAKARRSSARATSARLATVVAKAKPAAPLGGVVLERHAEAGAMVGPGTPLYTIADLSRLRIEAEVGEFDAPHVRLGAGARVRAEGHDGRIFDAVVEEIPDRVVRRDLRPLDPSRPIDTRVLVVKLSIADPAGLKLGQRVEVEIPR
jgi:RND family efflux transporter MFP subunit